MPAAIPTPEILAGELDRRVTLQSPVYNEFEDEIVGWQNVTKVWAAVRPILPREVTEALRTVELINIPIVIRFRTDIDARWRIIDGDHTYEVLGLADVMRRRVQLLLNCQEVL